ncbi:S-layer homology domain-containing protein [Saccharibacillus alkalitolerans]|uniref:SLH domain-containing protein n=1 Tax=Saccharibacillus alkalitolerans TaxID=2705290 RepID=A0ABX0FB95_9BACL|nr:S-layer homology domain-containing protein [Saccharibacillus alkalitolerans]NGZ77229.1 hypothetical protein [Saccharibacillus alkalitolerans]
MKKSILASILTLPLLAGFAAPSQAAVEFRDIQNSYAKDAINQLVEAGILNGVGSGQFNPTGKITRQDFAIILAKALNLDTNSAPLTPTFSDVPASHYSYKFVEAAVAAELIKGTGGGEFGFGQGLSRQDMAVLFTRALGVDPAGKGENLKFADADAISKYARDAVGYAVEAQLMSSMPGNQFAPTGLAERQQVALVTQRFLKTAELGKTAGEQQKPEVPAPQPPKPEAPATQQPAPVLPAPSAPVTQQPVPVSPAPAPSAPVTIPDAPVVIIPVTPIADTEAPTLTLISPGPFTVGNSVVVRSSETGTVYLVPSASEIPDRSALDTLVLEGVAAKAPVVSANEDSELSTANLAPGAYKAYAVDNSGNVSAAVTGIELRQAVTGPSFSFFTPGMLGAFFPEELDPESVPSSADFKFTRVDEGSGSSLSIHHMAVHGTSISFWMMGSPVMGGTYEVVYAPKEGSAPIKTLSGKTYDSFTVQFKYDNHIPTVYEVPQEQILELGKGATSLSLSSAFMDWDEEQLTYTVLSDAPGVVEAYIDDQLYLNPAAVGAANITVKAKDGHGGEASFTFKVTVVQPDTDLIIP